MNVMIRATVAALALSGSAAYVSLTTTAPKTIVKASRIWVPTCPPDGKQSCGMGK